MRDDLLAGWHPLKDVALQCAMCVWRLTDHTMSSCEYGQAQFPAARTCHHFEAEAPDVQD